MKRTFGVGLSIAVIGAIGLFIADTLGLTVTNTMIGVGAGAIAGMVQVGSPLQRLGGFLIGFVLGVFFVAMLLGLIPGGGSVAGITVAFAIILIVVAFVHGLSNARLGDLARSLVLRGWRLPDAGVEPARGRWAVRQLHCNAACDGDDRVPRSNSGVYLARQDLTRSPEEDGRTSGPDRIHTCGSCCGTGQLSIN